MNKPKTSRPDSKTRPPRVEATPETLQSLLEPRALLPGTTVLLREGVYAEQFYSRAVGKAEAPILFMPRPGANVTFAGCLDIYGAWTEWRGFDFTNLDTSDDYPGAAIEVHAAGTKLINLWLDRCGQGIGSWAHDDCEIYGCILNDCGWVSPTGDRKGHGLYVQSSSGKLIEHNLIVNSKRFGVHAYGESGKLDNMTFRENIVHANAEGFLWGGSKNGGANLTMEGNVLAGARIGYNAPGNIGLAFHGNFSLGQVQFNNWIEQIAVTGNRTVSSSDVLRFNQKDLTRDPFYPAAEWDWNIYHAAKGNPFATDGRGWFTLRQWQEKTGWDKNSQHLSPPPSSVVMVFPNRYEAGRAHIAIYQPAASPVPVLLDSVLRGGQSYTIYSPGDRETPVLSGVYQAGVPVTIPIHRTLSSFLLRGA